MTYLSILTPTVAVTIWNWELAGNIQILILFWKQKHNAGIGLIRCNDHIDIDWIKQGSQ